MDRDATQSETVEEADEEEAGSSRSKMDLQGEKAATREGSSGEEFISPPSDRHAPPLLFRPW